MKDPGTLLQFPCRIPIKAMGRQEKDFRNTVVEIVARHTQPVSEELVTEQRSSAGNFVSVTITVNATSREQLDRIYQDLTECKKVLMAL